jgi:hypothetical protein
MAMTMAVVGRCAAKVELAIVGASSLPFARQLSIHRRWAWGASGRQPPAATATRDRSDGDPRSWWRRRAPPATATHGRSAGREAPGRTHAVIVNHVAPARMALRLRTAPPAGGRGRLVSGRAGGGRQAAPPADRGWPRARAQATAPPATPRRGQARDHRSLPARHTEDGITRHSAACSRSARPPRRHARTGCSAWAASSSAPRLPDPVLQPRRRRGLAYRPYLAMSALAAAGLALASRSALSMSGATMVASDSTTNMGVSSVSLSQVIFSLGVAPEYEP